MSSACGPSRQAATLTKTPALSTPQEGTLQKQQRALRVTSTVGRSAGPSVGRRRLSAGRLQTVRPCAPLEPHDPCSVRCEVPAAFSGHHGASAPTTEKNAQSCGPTYLRQHTGLVLTWACPLTGPLHSCPGRPDAGRAASRDTRAGEGRLGPALGEGPGLNHSPLGPLGKRARFFYYPAGQGSGAGQDRLV